MATVITLIKGKEIVNQGIVKGAPMANRFDASIIEPNIYLAEDRFLKTFICPAFYDDLVLQKNTTPSQYNPDLGTLVQAYPTNSLYEYLWTEYLLAYLSRAVYFQSLPYIAVQSASNGLFENTQNFGTNIGISGMKWVRDEELQTLEARKEIIIKYLCDNKLLFSLFDADKICGCGCGNENAQSEGKTGGIVFY